MYPTMRILFLVLLTFLLSLLATGVVKLPAQDVGLPRLAPDDNPPTEDAPLKKQVDVKPVAEDEAIASRLERIMRATGWFKDPKARVDEGVVFLSGTVDSVAHQDWATKLAGQTQDVVAVVNQLDVQDKPLTELSPAWNDVRMMFKEFVHSIPVLIVAAIVLALGWVLSGWSAKATRAVLEKRWRSALLRDVMARTVAIPVFLFGIYLALRVSGLTQMAVTLLGGTGLVGLILGFAFRDIAENFLASILISVQHPFATGDMIGVDKYEGFVQSVNMRATVLTTPEGNRVEIPNSMIYKLPITNKSNNPNVRIDLVLPMSYEQSISSAQTAILKVLQDHEAVLRDPEPLVLADAVNGATVNLVVQFWINGRTHNGGKVKSAIIRLAKIALREEGILKPYEAPPASDGHAKANGRVTKKEKEACKEDETSAHEAEGNLASDDEKIIEQGDQGRKPAEVNLLEA
jgi:small-conductance mechanosensitive channel